MKYFFLISFLFTVNLLSAQYVYTIKADSVKLTNCDSTELILENHTQNIAGFLYNTGNGRTAFKRPVTKINDTLYLIGSDTLRMRFPMAWVQGGNSFGTVGFLGTHDNQPLDLYSGNTRGARLTPTGHMLLGSASDSTFRLDVSGTTRILPPTNGGLQVAASDGFNIGLVPDYVHNAEITFGNIAAAIGVNRIALGAIPAFSLLMGGISPGRIAAITSYQSNPVFVVAGDGTATINGGFSRGVSLGDSGTTANTNAPDFRINGGIGTGTGIPGDIIFSTGNSQASGATVHTMTAHWWLKSTTGYLSNTSTPTSSLDLTGANGYSQFRMRTTYTPASTSDTNGNTGDFSWDSNYFYIKTPSGWKRSALTTF